MDTYKTYEQLTEDNCFSEKQGKTLTKILSDLVTKDYLEERLEGLRKDINSDMDVKVTQLRLEIKDVKLSMFAVAITMTGIIIAAMKLF